MNYNQDKLQNMINEYAKVVKERQSKNTGYWFSLRTFHNSKTSLKDRDFYRILKESIAKIGNYRTINDILNVANAYPEETNQLFNLLYSDSFSVKKDYNTVKEGLKRLAEKYCKEHNRKPLNRVLHSINYISTFLWIVKPSQYYVYVSSDIDEGCQYLEIHKETNQYNHDDNKKLEEQISVFNNLKSVIIKNEVILKAINDFNDIDPNHNTLVIDFFSFIKEQIGSDDILDDVKIIDNCELENSEIEFLKGGMNLLVYGAPGVGKSYYVNNIIKSSYHNRVIFHAEYTYFDFVGAYKPVPVFKKSNDVFVTENNKDNVLLAGTPYINYEFVPGPFIDTLVAAYCNPNKMHYLVIEELNRANAAAVFGDIFQLLDRDADGRSEYNIKPSRELRNYLYSLDLESVAEDFRIPSNMSIYATMNSADQGVNYMDSAFKRRWNYEYLPIDTNQEALIGKHIKYAGEVYPYADFLSQLNNSLKNNGVDEDRLIGPWFIKIEDNKELISQNDIQKLNLYLWDDIFRHNRTDFFENIHTLKELNDGFSDDDVFGFKDKLKPVKSNEE